VTFGSFAIPVAWAILGAAAGVLWMRFWGDSPSHDRLTPHAVALFVAAAVYPVYAGWNGVLAERIPDLIAVGVFATFAWIGRFGGRFVLGLGWCFHAVYDLGIHLIAGERLMPPVYPSLCIGFDLVVGAWLLRGAWRVQIASRS